MADRRVLSRRGTDVQVQIVASLIRLRDHFQVSKPEFTEQLDQMVNTVQAERVDKRVKDRRSA